VSELRIVADDVIELGGVPVARLLPCLKLSLRDELTWAFDVIDEDAETIALLEARIAQLEARKSPSESNASVNTLR
jgi:BMFP domain-containing protein YqiC